MYEEEKNIVNIDSIEGCLSEFQPTSIKELDSLSLFRRYDTKFLFNTELIPDILSFLKDAYNVLEIEEQRLFHYENLYYDTDDYFMYLQHHNGKLNRYKVRFRRYIESDSYFFEIKKKTKRRKTVKLRIPHSGTNTEITNKEKNYIHNWTLLSPEIINPKLWCSYTRITLVHKEIPEKVTIDFELSFNKENNGTIRTHVPNLAVAELKQERFSKCSDFYHQMTGRYIPPMRLSKYCLGILLTNPEVKYNRFKPRLLTINKILNGFNGKHKLFKRTLS